MELFALVGPKSLLYMGDHSGGTEKVRQSARLLQNCTRPDKNRHRMSLSEVQMNLCGFQMGVFVGAKRASVRSK